MVFKNANYKELEFDITPVRIVRKGTVVSDQSAIENQMDKGFGDPSKPITDDLKNLETYLNTQSLNQALLKANIGTVYDVEIDEAQWIVDDLIIAGTKVFKGNQLLDKFYEEFKKQHKEAANKRGIIVYLAPLKHSKSGGPKGAGGYGDLGDIDAKHCVIFKSNLHHKESFAHEIAHVAGLEHSFRENNKLTEREVFERNRFIEQVDEQINHMQENSYSKKEIAKFWKKHKEMYKMSREDLNVYYRNPYKFKQGKTENFMDYYNTEKSFWKFQWKALQDDIIKFYN